MKIEEAILYCLASQNRRTSESRIKLACILPSEEEEEEVNRGMRTEQIAEMINLHGYISAWMGNQLHPIRFMPLSVVTPICLSRLKDGLC